MLSTPGIIVIWRMANELFDIANKQRFICHDVGLFAIVNQVPSSAILRGYPGGPMLSIPSVSIPIGLRLKRYSIFLINNISYFIMLQYFKLLLKSQGPQF